MLKVFLLAILGVLLAPAQSSVSIELPSKPGGFRRRSPSVYTHRNGRLLDAVAYCYGTDEFHIVAPDWFRDARYDITADAAGGDPLPLLRHALEEKFALNVGWENRTLESWVLERAEYSAALTVAGESERIYSRISPSGFSGTTTIEQLARMLRFVLHTEVADETGVGGVFRFSIDWSPNDISSIVKAIRDAGLELVKEYQDTNVLVVYSAYWPDAPQPPRYGCEPISELKSAIMALTTADDIRLPVEERIASARRVLEAYPENIFAEMVVQDILRDDQNLSKSWVSALSRYRSMRDISAAEFLEARLLKTAQPARSRSLLDDLLKQHPTFAWAHLVSAEIAETQEVLEAGLRRFRSLCPSSLSDAHLYVRVKDPQLLDSAKEAFGRLLAGRTDDAALRIYPVYWRIRQRAGVAWPSNWLQLEVARIRQLDRFNDPVWVMTMKAGYELLGDKRLIALFLQRLDEVQVHP